MVDVYQEWSGPVKPLLGGLRRLKIELSDDLLKFAVVSQSYQRWHLYFRELMYLCMSKHA